jgi:branched-chain amino acid transport system ATP-binding protein
MTFAPFLDIRSVTAGYGDVTILRDMSLSVVSGSVTALLGRNGAGKTTLMKTIAGLLRVRGGRIDLNSRDITRLRSNRRVEEGLVLVPEGRLIFPHMTVEDNLRIGAFTRHARERSGETLDRVYQLFPRLKERRTQYGSTLSGGEQQMLAIGRGLMAHPRLLLLDEPTLGLAPVIVELIFKTIVQLRELGVTILIAEQNVRKTLAIADTGYVLESGHTVLSGTASDLLAHPELNAAYFGIGKPGVELALEYAAASRTD